MTKILRPVFAVAVAALMGSSAYALTDLPINGGISNRQHINITVPNPAIYPLMRKHQDKCLKMGSSNCRIQLIGGVGGPEPLTGSLTLRFAPKIAEGYIASITADVKNGNFSRSDHQGGNGASDNQKGQVLEKELLLVQQQKLRSMEVKTTDIETKQAIGRKLRETDSRIANIEEQFTRLAKEFGVEEVTINYMDVSANANVGNSPESRRQRDWEQVLDMVLYGLIGSVAVAFMTMFYLGGIAFSFLGLRKLAQKTGLIKSGSSAAH